MPTPTPTIRLARVSAYKLIRYQNARPRIIGHKVSLLALHHTDCDCKVLFNERPSGIEIYLDKNGMLDIDPVPSLGYTTFDALKRSFYRTHCFGCDTNCMGVCEYSRRIELLQQSQLQCSVFGFISSLLTDDKTSYCSNDFCSVNGVRDAVMAYHALALFGGYDSSRYIALPWNQDFVRQVYEQNPKLREYIPTSHLRILDDIFRKGKTDGRWKELDHMLGQVLGFIYYQCDDGALPGINGRILTTDQLKLYNAAKHAWANHANGAALPMIP